MSNFPIKAGQFEGPLALLLNLIEKRKLLINEISLAQVADDFLKHLNSRKESDKFPMEDIADFLVTASTLLLIKSRSLLPSLEITGEEQGDIKNLENRLKLYQRFRALSKHIEANFGRKVIFEKMPSKIVTPIFTPDKETTIPGLHLAMQRVLQNLPKISKIPQAIVRKVVSLEETIEKLITRVNNSLKTSFKDFAKGDKVTVIVNFLALLELVKRGIVNASQNESFEDITLETVTVGIPSYQ